MGLEGSSLYTGFCQYGGGAVPVGKTFKTWHKMISEERKKKKFLLYLQTLRLESSCQSLGCGTWCICPCTTWGLPASKEPHLCRWDDDTTGWRSLGKHMQVKSDRKGRAANWCSVFWVVFTVEDAVGHSATGSNRASAGIFQKWLTIWTWVLGKMWYLIKSSIQVKFKLLQL